MIIDLIGDIDIDTGDRTSLLEGVQNIPASMLRGDQFINHNTGVYFHNVPVNPFGGSCSLGYDVAERMGCYKIDIINNHIYDDVQNETHLNQLVETPPMWDLLDYPEIVKELAHINNHYELVKDLKPRSIKQLAMLLAMIRPGKRHLVKKCQQYGWDSLEPEIWQNSGDRYTFKKSHAISLSMSIQVQLNLLIESTVSETAVFA